MRYFRNTDTGKLPSVLLSVWFHSEETYNICFHTTIYNALDNGSEIHVCSIVFDLSKVFDTVSHLSLLNKLTSMQVNPFLLRWTQNYLSKQS